MTTQPAAATAHTSRPGLHYVLAGAGPAVVLVHSWCLNRQVWMYLEQALVADGHTVITPSAPGSSAPQRTTAGPGP